MTVRVEVECNLVSADSGRVTLVIQEGESGPAPIANVVQGVRKGKARLVLSKSIKVPDTRAIRVFTPLNVNGGSSTHTADSRIYQIEKTRFTSASQPDPARDAVKIISITPDPVVPFRVGQNVTFRAEVEYNLISADSGEVILAVQQDESNRPSLAKVTEVVVKGKARVVLNADTIVPDTKAVLVFIPLSVGRGATAHESRSYKVAKN